MLVAAVLGGCSAAALPPVPRELPLFERIDARVGTTYTDAARSAVIAHPLFHIEIGAESVARFEKAFAAMFERVDALPAQPSWRERIEGVDGVIELESVDAAFEAGNDTDRPDHIRIAYVVCLFEPNGAEVRCWAPEAEYTHQRGLAECLDLRACVLPETEIVVREAIAEFLVEAQGDSALRAWAARVEHRETGQ